MTDGPGRDAPTDPDRRCLEAEEEAIRFRRVADALPALVWVSGPDGRCTWFNAQWLAFVGRAMPQEVGDGWADNVHPEDVDRCVATYREAIAARAPLSIQYRLRRHDGVYRWVLDQASPVAEPDGTFGGFVGACVDITEQMQAGRAQSYLAAIVESSDDAIIAKDLNGIIQSCNASAQRLFGYSAEELIGRPVRILIPAERQHEEDDILMRLRRGERIDHFETVRVRKNGERIDISLTVSPVRDFTGAIVGVSKVARDITAQKRAAAELSAQQAWFRTTLSSIGDAVVATDPAGRVTYMNACAEHLTEWPLADAEGRPLAEVFEIIDEATRERVENPVDRVARLGQVVVFESDTLLIGRHGTERPIADSAAPIVRPHGERLGVVLVFRDVSDQRRGDAERVEAARERERLLEAERVARAEAERASRVKDDFVAMVSHELRTPLNAILGWTQLMMQHGRDPAVLEKGLAVVARNTRIQAQLISDLLDISRIVAGKLQLDIQPIELEPIIGDAIETIQGEADARGVEIRREIDGGTGPLAGDPARLQQVVWNLLSNAVKFTPRGGTVTVRVRARPDGTEVQVADTGAGMRPDILPFVFDRFQQADRSITRRFGGLGLGLAIVKHLVDLHGGDVRAESSGEGMGSTFTVILPSSRGVTRSIGAEREQPASGWIVDDTTSLEGLHVLVVEDEPDTREFLIRLLETHGAVVTPARSATEALVMFRQSRPDLLVSDIGLPEIDGYDLIRRIRREHPGEGTDIPAIALTAYARSEDRMRALRSGFQGHLAKPIEAAELIAAVSSFRGMIEAQRRNRRGSD